MRCPDSINKPSSYSKPALDGSLEKSLEHKRVSRNGMRTVASKSRSRSGKKMGMPGVGSVSTGKQIITVSVTKANKRAVKSSQGVWK